MVGLTRAPEIGRTGLRWLNVDAPLSLPQLGGKLVVLDFSSYCCINCLHTFPTLRHVEERFPDELVVIGVHSPKFDAERDIDNLAHALARHDIRHPVIHDPDLVLWSEYCVRAWPTLVLIGPDGHILGQLAGEPDRRRLCGGIGCMLQAWRDDGLLNADRLALAPIDDAGGKLRFPGKIRAVPGLDGAPPMWAVADTGHHQVALFDDAGREVRRFGCGSAGFMDCGAEGSAFDGPQGLVAGPNGMLYVADTGNHAVRRIDLATGDVLTLAGTGRRGTALPTAPKPTHETDLASPWDLEIHGNRLFFANAGTHQLGEIDLAALTTRALAGSGAEDIADGPALHAQLAQPTGLALDDAGAMLYFVDSETSAVRRLSLSGMPLVTTLSGRGLFDFGHINGDFPLARFQHPMDLAWWNGDVVVADSYNGAIRVMDLSESRVRDLDLAADSAAPTGEPTGIVAAGPDRLLVSDTNRHRVVEIIPSTRSARVWIG